MGEKHAGDTTGRPNAEEALPLVSVTMPGMHAVTSTVTFTGALAARYDMPIGAEGEGGRIVAVLAEVGDHVKKGQVLARLDQSVLRPQVQRLQAMLEQARAQAALSAAEFHRVLSMEAAGALSVEEIERRRAAAVTDEAKVRVAAAELAETQARLIKTDIRTPQDGVVLTRSAEIGQTASPGEAAVPRGRRWRNRDARPDRRARYRRAVGGPARQRLYHGRRSALQGQRAPARRRHRSAIPPGRNPDRARGRIRRCGRVRSRAAKSSSSNAQRTGAAADRGAVRCRGTYVFVLTDKNIVERRTVRVSNATADGIVICRRPRRAMSASSPRLAPSCAKASASAVAPDKA